MSTDMSLQQAVLSALRSEPKINAAHIGVIADEGVVTLTGHVPTYAQKQDAENAAAGVRGVRGVAEEIEVRLPYSGARTDDDIAKAAANRLSWDVNLPIHPLRVTVEQGWVTLSGEVDERFQKEAAEEDIRNLYGVVGVSNIITVRPNLDAGDISEAVAHALNRSWFFDPQSIHVSVDEGKVRLTGNARTLHEARQAAAAAWKVKGVTDVENDIVVV